LIAVSYHHDLKEVQADAALAAWLDAPLRAAPFDRLGWWQALAEDCAMVPRLALARADDGAMLALPLALGTAGAWTALANWYSFRVVPLVTPGADAMALATALARDVARHTGRITLPHVPDDDGEATLLATAFARAGWWVRRAAGDTNHILRVGGRSFADYMATRPGPLRTTLKRKAKKVELRLTDQFCPQDWADYEAVYAASWKPEEGSPAFIRRFAQEEAAAGRLRLGFAYADLGAGRVPVAAQLWSVEGTTAFIHKLAYDEAAKHLSPGTTLCAALFERVIDHDRVALVDFGTGDDGYKRDWMEEARPRYRLEMVRPWQPAQWPYLGRHLVRMAAGAIKRRLAPPTPTS